MLGVEGRLLLQKISTITEGDVNNRVSVFIETHVYFVMPRGAATPITALSSLL